MKVVDLSWDVAGRFAAKLFVGPGVTVLRPRLDDLPPTDLDVYLDIGKVRPVLTLAEVRAAAVEADLVFTSFDRGALQGLGAQLDPPLAAVHVTTSTFGMTGPYAGLRGGPLAEWSAGGYLGITGDPDREPLIGPERLCGYVAGYTAAIAAEAALAARRRTGRGQRVDVSSMEAMLCVHQSTFARVAAGLGRRRTGRYTEVYPLVVRPCRDGHISLGVVTDAEFDRLAIAMGRAELSADPRFGSPAARWEHRDALDEAFAEFLMARSCDEAVETLRSFGVASAKVAGVLEVVENPQLLHRGFWRDGPDGGVAPGDPIPEPRRLPATGGPPAGALRGLADPATRELPLAGVTVLDFTAFWAGPSATRNLADFGATVIKVERPGSRLDLDDATAPGGVVGHLYHCKMNRGKLSVALDLEAPAGREIARRLACEADVLVENFRPGVADRLGVGPAGLCAANPGLVYVSLSGFGADGPWGDLRSYGPTIEAASSIAARTGYAGGEPLRLGHTLPDGVGGLAGALAALRGLRERETRGQGGWFDLSQLEAYVALSGEEILTATRTGETPRLVGNRSRSGAIQGVFPCRGEDQWIAIRLDGAADAGRLAAAVDRPDLAGLARGPRDDDRIEALIAGVTRDQDKFALAARLQAAGLEAVPVFSPDDLVADPQLAARKFFVQAAMAGGQATLPGTPVHGEPPLADPGRPAPRFGEDTERVIAALAGGRPEA